MSELRFTPHISEKAIALAESGVYVFEVPLGTNKPQVAEAISRKFEVEVVSVNMMIAKGKTKLFKRIMGRQNDTKKALVKLKAGQSIKLFEGSK